MHPLRAVYILRRGPPCPSESWCYLMTRRQVSAVYLNTHIQHCAEAFTRYALARGLCSKHLPPLTGLV